MSYDLGVFYTEKPLTDEDAVARYVAYCEEQDLTPFIEPSPRIAAFLKELTDRYPQLHDMADEELENCPWHGSFDVSKGHVLMPITYFWAPDLSEVVVDLAAKHGLVCVDPQSSEILTAPPALLAGKEAGRLARKPAPKPSEKGRPSLEDVVSEISQGLARFGFVPRRKDEFIWEVNEDVVAYIGLDGRESRHDTEISPTIGLRHNALMDLVRTYDKSKVYEAIPLAFIKGLGHVTPRRRSVTPQGHLGRWRFGDGEGGTVAREILAEIEAHAIPYFEAKATLGAIVTELLYDDRGQHETAAGLYLSGRYDETLLYLEAQLTKVVGDDGKFWRKYRQFARDLIQRMRDSGAIINPDQQARLDLLTADPQRGASDGYFREQPFVDLLDELLLPRGFSRSGLIWHRDGHHACVDLILEPDVIDRILVIVHWNIFSQLPPVPPGEVLPRDLRLMLYLENFCTEPMARRLQRALCFCHDFARSGVLQRQGGLTDKQERRAIEAMEPGAPLTMSWRLSALRMAVADHALPLLERIESSVLTRLRLSARVAIHGDELGHIWDRTVRSLKPLRASRL